MGNQVRVVRVAIVNTLAHPATDAEILHGAVEFANGADLLLQSRSRSQQASSRDRNEFVALLSEAVMDRGKALERFLPTAQRLFSRSGLRASLTFAVVVGRGLQRGLFLDFRTPRAVLDYALALVLDGTHPLGSKAARCKLPRCHRFYIARKNPRGGPAPLVYCSSAHRDEHHDSSARRLGKA